jgi:hypothetical protein
VGTNTVAKGRIVADAYVALAEDAKTVAGFNRAVLTLVCARTKVCEFGGKEHP